MSAEHAPERAKIPVKRRDFYSVDHFCELKDISRASVYREIAGGHLEVCKFGGKTLISDDAAERWAKARIRPAAA